MFRSIFSIISIRHCDEQHANRHCTLAIQFMPPDAVCAQLHNTLSDAIETIDFANDDIIIPVYFLSLLFFFFACRSFEKKMDMELTSIILHLIYTLLCLHLPVYQ